MDQPAACGIPQEETNAPIVALDFDPLHCRLLTLIVFSYLSFSLFLSFPFPLFSL